MDKEWLEEEDVIEEENEWNSDNWVDSIDPPDDWEPDLPPFDLPKRD